MIYIGLFLAYMAGVITMCLFQINKDHNEYAELIRRAQKDSRLEYETEFENMMTLRESNEE